MGRSADLPRQSGEVDGDDRGCHILHVDMDAFFASVEIRADPSLRGKPVVVGGTQGRGVVAAASYEARKYGVRSAMSMGQALRLCPRAVVVPPSRGLYSEASRAVMAIFADFTPAVEPLSLDEAFLDISGSVGLFGRPADIARAIRARVEAEQQLTCSVGIASAKSVAKLASGSCKPDGLRVVSRDGVLGFLHPLPVTALWGVGDRTAEPLRRLGIRTVGDLASTPLDLLRRTVGDAHARHLHALANGHDDRVVAPREREKSISTDRTLLQDLLTREQVALELLRGAEEVAGRLRSAELTARTIGIKIRYADFSTVTRVRTITEATDAAPVVYAEALALYDALQLDRPRIRLVGVKAENLRSRGDATQLALPFDTAGGGASPAGAGGAAGTGGNDGAAGSDVTAGDGVAAGQPPGARAVARSAPVPVRATSARRPRVDAGATADEIARRFPDARLTPASLLRTPSRQEDDSPAVRSIRHRDDAAVIDGFARKEDT